MTDNELQNAAHSLLPCPFCESQPEWINKATSDGHFYIRCPHCHIVMKEDRRDKVKGMWNRRAELTRLRSELQQRDEEITDARTIITLLITLSEGRMLSQLKHTSEYIIERANDFLQTKAK
jgi:Zn-finger protein